MKTNVRKKSRTMIGAAQNNGWATVVRTSSRLLVYLCMMGAVLVACVALPQSPNVLTTQGPVPEWAAVWTASVHGPYPVGTPIAQPDLSAVIPSADQGFVDQSLRMIVRPAVWGREARIRLSNAFGKRPVTFDGAFVGLQSSGSALVPGTNQPVRFAGESRVTVQPGGSVISDPVALPWIADPANPMLANRRLAVSFHVVGESGPITWHSKAVATSYLSAPRSGMVTAAEAESGFPFMAMSWFFLDEVDMRGSGARTVVALGDSITDGTGSTINGDDRWPDVLSRRLYAAYGNAYSVVNAGIGANMVVGPSDYAQKPWPGGEPATVRLERDVLSLPGVVAVIWLEGINDFSTMGKFEVPTVEAGVRDVVVRLRQRFPGVRVIMATVTSAKSSTFSSHGTAEVDEKRQAFNRFIRTSGLFDAVVDFDAVVTDPKTGELKPEYVPSSSIGGNGDKLHPNRAGYAAMAYSINLQAIVGGSR